MKASIILLLFLLGIAAVNFFRECSDTAFNCTYKLVSNPVVLFGIISTTIGAILDVFIPMPMEVPTVQNVQVPTNQSAGRRRR
jgi:hypothetical protein